MKDLIEFWLPGQLLAACESSHAPDRGECIAIRSKFYRVIGRTYTVDHAAEHHLTQVLCIITLEPSKASGPSVFQAREGGE